MRALLLAAVAGAVLAVGTAGAAAPPLGITHVGASRTPALLTINVVLSRPWKSGLLAPASTTQLRVLYDSNADGSADYTGRIVYRGTALVEELAGHGNRYEPVPVSRPSAKSLRFTHPVDALYTGVKVKRTLRIAVQVRDGKHVDRLPSKGWIVVPEPR